MPVLEENYWAAGNCLVVLYFKYLFPLTCILVALSQQGRIEFSDPGNGYLPSASEFLNIHKGIYFSPSYGLFAFALGSSKGLLLLSFQCFSS